MKTVRFLEWLAQHYNRLEVYGIEHVPDKGHGGILCANHPALLDPGFIHIAVHTQKDRWMRWLGWSGLFKASNKFIKWIIHEVESIVPVDEHEGKALNKESVIESMDNIGRELAEGHLVGIFPEGKNHNYFDYKEPYRFRTGAIRMALKNDVPIIPVAVYGTHKVWPSFGEIKKPYFHMWLTIPGWFPAKVKVAFGAPFVLDPALKEDPDNYDLLRAETERLRDEIYALTETLY